MNREDAVKYIYNRIVLSEETEQNNAFAATWVQLEITILSEVRYHTKWSKSERERQTPSEITYMWNLTYDIMKLSMKQKQNHRYRELIESLGLADANWYV